MLVFGCATNPNLSPAQKVDLKPYFNQVNNACIAHHKRINNYTDSTNLLCVTQTKYMIDNMEASYLKYNEKVLVDKCDTSDRNKLSECLFNEQNSYYLKTINSLTQQAYPSK